MLLNYAYVLTNEDREVQCTAVNVDTIERAAVEYGKAMWGDDCDVSVAWGYAHESGVASMVCGEYAGELYIDRVPHYTPESKFPADS